MQHLDLPPDAASATPELAATLRRVQDRNVIVASDVRPPRAGTVAAAYAPSDADFTCGRKSPRSKNAGEHVVVLVVVLVEGQCEGASIP